MEGACWPLQPGRVPKEELGPSSAGRMGQARRLVPKCRRPMLRAPAKQEPHKGF